MEPESSLAHSQQPATCSYAEPDRSSLRPLVPLPEDSFYYYPPIYDLLFQMVSIFCLPLKNHLYTSRLPILATYPTDPIFFHFITRKKFGL